MYNLLASLIGKALKDGYGVSKEVTLVPPEDGAHGDLSTNVAMQVSKTIGKPPLEIAHNLASALRGQEGIESVEVAGQGFLNLTLRRDLRLKQLRDTREACLPRHPHKDANPIIIEYSQPNIAKPLGVHHILSTVIGQAVANLYRHLGYRVISWNYIGDWGTQFGKLAVAMERWGGGKPIRDYSLDELLDLYVRFHEEMDRDASLEEAARDAFRKLEQGDQRIRTFWEDVVEITSASIQRVYDRLHVSFDESKGESFYEDKMEAVISEGKRRGVFSVGEEGALIVEFPEGSGLPVYMVLKADAATLYSTRDLAQMRYRIDHYHPEAILIFTDIAQKLYFQQLEATCRRLGWELPRFENVLFGRMSFPDKSMSTRKGNIISLEAALDEAVRRADCLIAEHESQVQGKEREDLKEMLGVGAFVYAILSQSRKTNIVFTWEKALTFDGNSGPYLQYTHARARSVLRKGGVDAEEILALLEKLPLPVSSNLFEKEEMALMRRMAQFPTVLEEAREGAMPHKLAHFLYSLCQEFNTLYNALPILEAKAPQHALRLSLTALTAEILKTGAEILTLRVPDRM